MRLRWGVAWGSIIRKAGNPAANCVKLASHSRFSAQNYSVVKNPTKCSFSEDGIAAERGHPSQSVWPKRLFPHSLGQSQETFQLGWNISGSALFVNMTRWPLPGSTSILHLYLIGKLQRNEPLRTGRELSGKKKIQMKCGKLEHVCNVAYMGGVSTLNSKVVVWQVLQIAEKDKK